MRLAKMLWEKASLVLSCHWCSIKYCFGHIFANKYLELIISYPQMLEKYIITILIWPLGWLFKIISIKAG